MPCKYYEAQCKAIVLVNGELGVLRSETSEEAVEPCSIELIIDEAIDEAQEEYDNKATTDDASEDELKAYESQVDTLVGMGEEISYGGRRM